MANVNSVEYAKTITNPPTMLDPWQDHGKLRVAYATYESSSFAANDTLTLFVLPKGANVVGGHLWMDANASSTTVSVGDSTDADGYVPASTALGTAAKSYDMAATLGAYWTGTVPLAADQTVILTLAGANSTDARTFRCAMYYVMD